VRVAAQFVVSMVLCRGPLALVRLLTGTNRSLCPVSTGAATQFLLRVPDHLVPLRDQPTVLAPQKRGEHADRMPSAL
jgi:hypothetical protein